MTGAAVEDSVSPVPAMPDPPTKQKQSLFGRAAGRVDAALAAKFHRIGLFVGTRPGLSFSLSLLLMVLCAGGFSQFNAENRPDKLWIPQGTRAQDDEIAYTSHFPPAMRLASVLLEAKTGSALDKPFLMAALELHEAIEKVSFGGKNLTSICVPQPVDGHPCFIASVLGTWGYSRATLAGDPDPLATLNGAGKSPDDLKRMLGDASFSGTALESARALQITYFVQLNRVKVGGDYVDENGEGWEKAFLDLFKCDEPSCSGEFCACGYMSDKFLVYASATRSWSDAFGEVLQGDIGLVQGAFVIMIVYLVVNLGGLCHKVNSRALLAYGCTLSIVAAGAAGYGLAMWCQFDYTPIHGVLPFVLIGIGVDDSFVIINALDRTDRSMPVPERIAHALSHAGISIMVTSLTDFVAFAISVASALPALSSFCMYAAFCVLMLFTFQITMFTAMATLDARRVAANRIDCCFCLPTGWPCCPTVPPEAVEEATRNNRKDPNQMCCAACKPGHQGGRIGWLLETHVAPALVKPAVSVAVIIFFVLLCGFSAWQTTELSVQDTQRRFLPDDSYVLSTLEKNDVYFGTLGTRFDILTESGNYFATQRGLNSIASKLDELDYVLPASGDSFSSWAASFRAACANGTVGATVTLDSDNYVTVESQYYAGLKSWLSGAGRRHMKDVIWVDDADPQRGIKASKIAAEFRSVNKVVNGQVLPDAMHAVDVMDGIRRACDSWGDMPGGKATPYTYKFLSWETFKIIKEEMFLSVGLCLLAVLVITLGLIAHPLTSGLVFISVVMTIVDVLGCMNLWGLAIDSVSVIQLVIAVGLSVDYAAHVGHNFMAQEGSRQERVVAALGDVGAAVLCGGISTFLGVMLLAASSSYVFRVLFQSFFLTVILGLAHGMLLLPALLSLVGPASYKSGSKPVRAW